MAGKNKIWILLIIVSVFFSGCGTRSGMDIANILSPYLLPDLKKTKLMRVSSHDSLGNTSINLPAGKTAIIFDTPGPGLISRIWLSCSVTDARTLRQLLIRMYWDQEKTPSVEVPFCDFFGSGYGYHEFSSQFLSMSGGGYTCWFPMPFEDNARIEIVNESEREIAGLTYQVDYHKIDTYLSSDIGYFHASWRREVRTDNDSNFTIINTRGKGHVVGLNLNIQSYNGRFDYLSGKEIIFIDGEKRPSITGTGTADYFMSGNNFASGPFQTPAYGLILKDDSLGRISAYRFHIADAISFKKSIIFSIEHGRDNQDIADYSATVYWYQVEPHKPFPPIQRSAQRIPLRTVTSSKLFEAENLPLQMGTLKSRIEDMTSYGTEWSGSKQLVIEAKKGSDLSVRFSRLQEVSYDAEIYFTRGPKFGNADVFINDEKGGEIKGYASVMEPGGKIIIHNIPNPVFTFDIRFVVTGKDSLAKDYWLGIDGITLIPNRDFIPEFRVSGPYVMSQKDLRKRIAPIDAEFAPETGKNDKLPRGVRTPGWVPVKPGVDGYVSLDSFINPNEQDIIYAASYVYSPEPGIMYLYVGSDDAMKVFLNEKQVYKYTGQRFAEPDQGQVYIRLKKGWNHLLLKIVNKSGSSGFYARILDREKILRYTSDIKDTIR